MRSLFHWTVNICLCPTLAGLVTIQLVECNQDLFGPWVSFQNSLPPFPFLPCPLFLSPFSSVSFSLFLSTHISYIPLSPSLALYPLSLSSSLAHLSLPFLSPFFLHSLLPLSLFHLLCIPLLPPAPSLLWICPTGFGNRLRLQLFSTEAPDVTFVYSSPLPLNVIIWHMLFFCFVPLNCRLCVFFLLPLRGNTPTCFVALVSEFLYLCWLSPVPSHLLLANKDKSAVIAAS